MSREPWSGRRSLRFAAAWGVALTVGLTVLVNGASAAPSRKASTAARKHVVTAGSFVELRVGYVSSGSNAVSYRWRILRAPKGRRATLRQRTSVRPAFLARTPGTYRLRGTFTAANGTVRRKTVTIIVRADTPPIGWRLDTVADDRGTIKLNGTAVPNTTEDCDPDQSCAQRASYAVYNRQTLQLVTSGNYRADAVPRLLDLAREYDKAPTYLMVVNFQTTNASEEQERKLLEALGVPKMSDADLVRTFISNPVSIVGVPGSRPGSAFISNQFPRRYEMHRSVANMPGYLRLNPQSASGHFEFVFADQAEFDTDASTSRSQITMRFGDRTLSHDAPTTGASGFFLVRLNSRTLTREGDFFYDTNRPDGAQVPDAAQRMAGDIAWATEPSHQEDGDLLVMLQAFGHPKGNSAGWLAAARAIGKLGGNEQVFTQLNRGDSDEPHQGRYAFVARAGMDTPVAEASQSLTGYEADGTLHGLLARARDDQYEPVTAGPEGAVNLDLVKIVNRPSPAGGGFPSLSSGEAAAAAFLGRDPDIMGVCEPQAPTCNVRKAYWEDYAGTNWANILTRLGEPAKTACQQTHTGFTAADCDAARRELALEVGRRNTVEEYFGPKGLQAPFLGGAQVGSLVDIAKIADQIKRAVEPPEKDQTASNVFSVLSNIVKAGALIPGGQAYAAALSGAFSLAAYLTKPSGNPDLIGPQITTAAANLGSDINERYQSASAYFTTEAKIVMSDWSKLSEVAAVVNSPKWKLDDIPTMTERVRLATRQTIYSALVPTAYPVLYDLGTGVRHAADWYCNGGIYYDKHLFQNTGQGAELTWQITSGKNAGANHVIAVGARHAVSSLHSANIPAPPASLTDEMFRSPISPKGGIGLYKLQFYSTQNFDLFPKVLQQGRDGYLTCQSLPDPPGNSG
jgi:hypothetical protein